LLCLDEETAADYERKVRSSVIEWQRLYTKHAKLQKELTELQQVKTKESEEKRAVKSVEYAQAVFNMECLQRVIKHSKN